MQTLVASNCLGAQHAAAAVHGQSYSTTRRGPAARPQRGHAVNALAPNAMPAAAATVVREAAGAQPVAGVPSERGVPTPPERTGPLAQSQAQSPSLPPGQISTTPSAAAGSDTPMCVGETPVSGHEVLVNTLPGSRVSEVGVGGGAGGNAATKRLRLGARGDPIRLPYAVDAGGAHPAKTRAPAVSTARVAFA